MRGTATRSAHRTATGPAATTAVASTPRAAAQRGSEPPRVRAHTEAAITLLRAIQAKFVTYRRRASRDAPSRPRAARAAITEGTPRRGPTGARAATRAAP